ncbi:hypothetical protein NRB_38630 [Novosphingobium sp. 11B]
MHADAEIVAGVTKATAGLVALVGHSYGGSVISEVAEGAANVKGLVYVAAFAPEADETALGLTGKFPGSTLPGGANDLDIQQKLFPAQFAADLPAAQARLMAAGQFPVMDAVLSEPSAQPAWKHVPSWFVYGDADRNIPPAAMHFMAQLIERADAVPHPAQRRVNRPRLAGPQREIP